MNHGEGTCLASNIAARWSTIKHLMSRGPVLKYKMNWGIGTKNQQLLISGGTCLNIVFDQMTCHKNKEQIR